MASERDLEIGGLIDGRSVTFVRGVKMDADFLMSAWAHYNISYSAMAFAAFLLIPFGGKLLLARVPAVREADLMNHEAFQRKMANSAYARVQRSNHRWGLFYGVVIFGVIQPFYLTLEVQPYWHFARDLLIVLIGYDFLYYLVHRHLMHDGGPLVAIHALHHRQHDPCRMDSSYIHPLEVALALGLFVVSNAGATLMFGKLHVVTNVAAWITLQRVNLFNHHQWLDHHFPARCFGALAIMHRNHHIRFSGSNYGQISPLFDWLFGTLDLSDIPKRAGGSRR